MDSVHHSAELPAGPVPANDSSRPVGVAPAERPADSAPERLPLAALKTTPIAIAEPDGAHHAAPSSSDDECEEEPDGYELGRRFAAIMNFRKKSTPSKPPGMSFEEMMALIHCESDSDVFFSAQAVRGAFKRELEAHAVPYLVTVRPDEDVDPATGDNSPEVRSFPGLLDRLECNQFSTFFIKDVSPSSSQHESRVTYVHKKDLSQHIQQWMCWNRSLISGGW